MTFIGQDALRKILAPALTVASDTAEPLDHALIHGPSGCGKSHLAEEIRAQLKETVLVIPVGPTMKPANIAKRLRSYKGGGIVILDGLHRMTPPDQELLAELLDTGHYTAGDITAWHKWLTVIGITTDRTRISADLIDRFLVHLDFRPYTPAEMGEIVRHLVTQMNAAVTNAEVLGLAADGNPRKAVRLVTVARDLAIQAGAPVDAYEVLAHLQMDGQGRTAGEPSRERWVPRVPTAPPAVAA